MGDSEGVREPLLQKKVAIRKCAMRFYEIYINYSLGAAEK